MEAFEKETLKEQATHIEEEARMILPGIQALFGFQLIACFNQRFSELASLEQIMHYISLALTAIAMALVLTPAAYHREAEPGIISTTFCKLSSKLLCWALIPLALGISADFFLIGELVTEKTILSAGLAVALFVFFISIWFIFPQSAKRRNLNSGMIGSR